MKRRILCAAIALAMALSLLPGAAMAAGDTIEISTSEGLWEFAARVNAGEMELNAVLTKDIDLGCSEDRQWTPIAPDSDYYQGTFDGGGHTVSGLYIDAPNGYAQGLFSHVEKGGVVKNLNVEGSVSAYNTVGGVAGYSLGTLENCRSSVTVTGADRYVGGVVGVNRGSVTGCSNEGTVTGVFYTGGVVGENGAILGTEDSGPVTDCYNTGTVSGSFNVGGVIGTNGRGPITGCYNSGSVTSSAGAGGIVSSNSSGPITGCYNTGSVTGDVAGGIVSSDEYSAIKACYNTGDITGNTAGGIIGSKQSSTITDCYNTGSVTGESCAGGVAGYISGGGMYYCYNTGSVTAIRYTGGVVGNNLLCSVTDCYNVGDVIGDSENTGGVAGYNDRGSFKYCYYLNGTAYGGVAGADTADQAEALTKEQFADENSFSMWGFGIVGNRWVMDEKAGRPVLREPRENSADAPSMDKPPVTAPAGKYAVADAAPDLDNNTVTINLVKGEGAKNAQVAAVVYAGNGRFLHIAAREVSGSDTVTLTLDMTDASHLYVFIYDANTSEPLCDRFEVFKR